VNPETLKAFREHFALTRAQICRYLRTDSREWYGWELGTRQIPPSLALRLKKAFVRITAARARRSKLCKTCGRNTETNNDRRCPYCSRLVKRTSAELSREILP
jgi:tRNA(Ile2) C34 agmatinyltransferase TiaS